MEERNKIIGEQVIVKVTITKSGENKVNNKRGKEKRDVVQMNER